MKVLIICMTKSTGTHILEVLRCQSIAHKQYLSQVSRILNTVVQTVEHMHNSVVVSVEASDQKVAGSSPCCGN